jgi:hypothetical protein
VADVLDFLQERLAVLLANGLAKQLPQQMHILAQTQIDIAHRASPLQETASPKSADSRPRLASRTRAKQLK